MSEPREQQRVSDEEARRYVEGEIPVPLYAVPHHLAADLLDARAEITRLRALLREAVEWIDDHQDEYVRGVGNVCVECTGNVDGGLNGAPHLATCSVPRLLAAQPSQPEEK
jgi:hypothetical protein